ncbi:hypothetical protein RCL1_008693 [Eukaryota sp. TZLM3-RCL]
MRLRIHNFLQCNKPKCPSPFPLGLQVTSVKQKEAPFDKNALLKFLERVNYPVLRAAAAVVDIVLPEDPSTISLEDEATARLIHSVLNEVIVVDGQLSCAGCGRAFPIRESICSFVNFTDPETTQ